MMLKKIWIPILACLMLTAVLTGCGCQAEKETTQEEQIRQDASEPVSPSEPRSLSEPRNSAEPEEQPAMQAAEVPGPAPKPRQNPDPAPTTRATVPQDDDFWLDELPTEDTRPPIEVPVPEQTQPYTDYEAYMDMSGPEQEAFFDSFDSEEAFFDWYHAAKSDYEKAHPPVIIDGSTNIKLKP